MVNSSTALPSQATAHEAPGLSSKREVQTLATRLLGTVFALLIMLALKQHFSLATADQLNWILAPTAKLLAWFTPAHPVYENGVGYVDFARGIVVAPACAGINFMIMAFGLTALCALIRIRRPSAGLIALAISLTIAYGYTMVVNTARIALSMALYDADIYGGWITLERVHRVAGIVLYLGALLLLFNGVRFITCRYDPSNREQGAQMPKWLPFCWYLLGAVGVPMANLIYRKRPPTFWEHTLTVIITVATLWALSTVLKMVVGRLRPLCCGHRLPL